MNNKHILTTILAIGFLGFLFACSPTPVSDPNETEDCASEGGFLEAVEENGGTVYYDYYSSDKLNYCQHQHPGHKLRKSDSCEKVGLNFVGPCYKGK